MADMFDPLAYSQDVLKNLPTRQPSVIDKLGDYLSVIQSNRDKAFERKKKKQAWDDEQELRQMQKDLAADFRAKPPANTEDFLKRTQSFFMQRGQPEKAMQIGARLEAATAARLQQEERIKAAKEAAAQKNITTLGLAVAKNPKALLIPQIQQQMGLAPDIAADLAVQLQAENEGKISNQYQFIEKYKDRPDELNKAYAIMSAMSNARQPTRFDLVKQDIPSGGTAWINRDPRTGQMTFATPPALPPAAAPAPTPEPTPAPGAGIPGGIEIPMPNLASPGAPLATTGAGTEGAPFVDEKAASKAGKIESGMQSQTLFGDAPKLEKPKETSDKPLPRWVKEELKTSENQIGMIDTILNVPGLSTGEFTGPKDSLDQWINMKSNGQTSLPQIRANLAFLRAQVQREFFGKALSPTEAKNLADISGDLSEMRYQSAGEFVTQMRELKRLINKNRLNALKYGTMTQSEAKEQSKEWEDPEPEPKSTSPAARPTQGVKY